MARLRKKELSISSIIVVFSNGSTLTIGKDHSAMTTQHFGIEICKTEDLVETIKGIKSRQTNSSKDHVPA
jgi:hypothetical protein